MATDKKPWDLARLQKMIDDQVEESIQLDYKAAGALLLNQKKEICTEVTKDISAFANSIGGTIIYGIREGQTDETKHLPETLDWLDRTSCSKERLESFITNIQPKIPGVLIHPVQGPNPTDVAYVVEIPEGTTAHMAKDNRYYRRFNFKAEAMQDYEVRMVMNRAKHASCTVRVWALTDLYGDDNEIRVSVTNTSEVLVQHYQVVLRMPWKLGNLHMIPERAYFVDTDDRSALEVRSLPDSMPLFPLQDRQVRFPVGRLTARVEGRELKPSVTDYHVRLYCDAAPCQEFRIPVEGSIRSVR